MLELSASHNGTLLMNPTTSLLDRADLDRDAVRHEVARGLSGADDGELFLEYAQTEALMFDNGRLKQATYDTSQGFGLRAVKDDAVGYAHSSEVSLPALMRAADAVQAVRGGYSGNFAAAPAHTNVRLYGDDNPLEAQDFESKVKLLAEIDAYVRGRDPRVRQVSVSVAATWQVSDNWRLTGSYSFLSMHVNATGPDNGVRAGFYAASEFTNHPRFVNATVTLPPAVGGLTPTSGPAAGGARSRTRLLDFRLEISRPSGGKAGLGRALLRTRPVCICATCS